MIKILLIEDNLSQLELTKKILEIASSKYEIEAISDPKIGLNKALKNTYDIIVCDYRMPDLSALDILRELNKSKINTPFVVFTASGNEKAAVELMKEGACDYVTKDAAFNDVLPFVIERNIEKHLLLDVNERAQKLLNESEERYRTLFTMEADAIMVFDSEGGKFIDVNQACEELYGYTKDEFYNLKHSDITNEDIDSKGSIKKTIGQGNLKIPIRYHKKKDGTVFPVEISGSSFILEGQKVLCGIVRNISDKKGIEDNLKQELSFNKGVIDNTTEGICVCHDINDFPYVKFSVWNNRMREITGYSIDEINKLGWYQSMYPDNKLQKKANDRMDKMRHGENLINEEWEITRIDGKKRILSISTTILQLDDGTAHVLGLMRDITEQKKAEISLHEKEKSYQLIAEHTDDLIAIVSFDKDLRYLYLSPSHTRIMGYEVEEMLGISGFDLMHPDDKKMLIPKYIKALTTKAKNLLSMNKVYGGDFIEYRVKKKTGEWCHLESRIDVVGDKLLFASRDVTERKKREEALIASEKRYKMIFESTGTATMIDEEDMTIVMVNSELENLLKIKRENLEGKKWIDYIYKDDHELLIKQHKRRRSNPDRVSEKFDFRMIDSKGNIKYVFAKVAMIPNSNRTMASIIDITDRKAVEEEMKSISNFPAENPNPILRISNKGDVLYTNESAKVLLRKLGVSQNKIRKILPENIDNLIKRELASGIPTYGHEVTLKDKCYSYSVSPVVQKNYVNLYAADITERKKIEEALRESGEYLKIVYEKAPTGYFLYDLKGCLIDCNEAAERIIGSKKGEFIGKNLLQIGVVPPDELVRVTILMGKTFMKNVVGPEEIKINSLDGRKILTELLATNLEIRGKKIILTSFVDITERKRIEDELNKKVDDLESFHKFTVGREIKMKELKKEVEELKVKILEIKKDN